MVNLIKGQKVDITKNNPSLTNLKIGLGWDVNSVNQFDLDAIALMVDSNGCVTSKNQVIYYNNLSSQEKSVQLSGDNLTGIGEGDDETITLSLSTVPMNIERIVLAITIHEATQRSQNFQQVNNAYVRIINNQNSEELYRYDLGIEFANETTVVVGEVYRYKDDWKFGALGTGVQGGLLELCKEYSLLLSSSDFEKKTIEKPSSGIRLSKIELKKAGDKINLEKKSQSLGEIKVNLNWNQQQTNTSGGFLSSLLNKNKGIDLDLGAFFEFKDGYKGVIQPLGKAFGSYEYEPYIHLDQDDRTGTSLNGENLRINGDRIKKIKRILIFAFIYEGVANWSQVDGVVTLKQQDGPEIIVKLDEHRNGYQMCAVAMLENIDDQTFKVEKLVKYFKGHREVDKAYGWNMKWKVASK